MGFLVDLVCKGLIGFIFAGGAALAVDGYRALRNPDSDQGAFVAGCIAGFIFGLLLFPIEGFVFSIPEQAENGSPFAVLIGASIVGGMVIGTLIGGLWAVLIDRPMAQGAGLGTIGGGRCCSDRVRSELHHSVGNDGWLD